MRSWWIPCVVVDDASAVGPSLSEDCVFHVVSRWRKCPIVSICHTGHVHTCRTPQASVGRHYSSLQFVAECVRALGKDGAPSVVGGNFRNLSNIERKIENARERRLGTAAQIRRKNSKPHPARRGGGSWRRDKRRGSPQGPERSCPAYPETLGQSNRMQHSSKWDCILWPSLPPSPNSLSSKPWAAASHGRCCRSPNRPDEPSST